MYMEYVLTEDITVVSLKSKLNNLYQTDNEA